MTATLVSIAEAVKDRLNAATFTPAFTAVRADKPQFELSDLDTLTVVVAPRAVRIHRGNRSKDAHDYDVDVGVLKKLDATANEDIDPLLALVEAIADNLRRTHLISQSALWQSMTNEPPYDLDYLVTHQQFASILTVTYRVLR